MNLQIGSIADWIGNFLTFASVSTALYFGLRVPKSKVLFDFKETTSPKNFAIVKKRFGNFNIYNQDLKNVILRIVEYSGCDISINSNDNNWDQLAGGTNRIKDSWLRLRPGTSEKGSSDTIGLSFDKHVENACIIFLDLTTNKKITVKLKSNNDIWTVYKVKGTGIRQ